MKVILLQDVKKLGSRGDMIDVAEGYARNFLIPRGLAEPATQGNVRRRNQEKKVAQTREAREAAEARELAAKLEAEIFAIQAKTGETGRLFGSVTSQDIADAVKNQAKVTIDRRKIELDEPIKNLGSYDVMVRLHADVSARLKVEVTSGA